MLGGLGSVHLSLLSMNSLNQTKTAIVTLVLHLLLPRNHIIRISISTVEGVKCLCGGRKKVTPYFVLSVVIYYFWSFGIVLCNSAYSALAGVRGR